MRNKRVIRANVSDIADRVLRHAGVDRGLDHGRLHWFFPLLVTVLAISNVAVIWMLREHRPVLARACRRKMLRTYLGWVCHFTGEQLPLETQANAKLLLRTKRDFEIAGMRAKQIVRGHDDVLDTVLSRIFENQTLRKSRRNTRASGPLASFLLVGPEGVGKRYLMRVIAKLLYGDGGVEIFDCERLTADTLTGTKDREGALLELVRRHPHRLILVERIEKASGDVSNLLIELLTTGHLRQPGSAKQVSFQEATVALTTTRSSSSLEGLANEEIGEAAFHQRAIDLIVAETQIDRGLLNSVTDVCFCAPPTDLVKAEVVALLMRKECRDHDIELSNVDPEILATQIIQIDDATGFRLVPQRVKKLLRKPLVAATPERLPSLSLRVRTPETAQLR